MNQTVTTIQGERVLLRPFQEGDVEEAARVWTPELTYLYGGSRRDAKRPSAESRQHRNEQMASGDEHYFAIEADARYIGFVGLKVNDEEQNGRYRIGIANPNYWSRGYGTEVARLMLRYAFDTLNLHRVHLRVAAYNVRARRCYEKAGFRIEGIERKNFQVDGEWQDDVLMAILREEWYSCRAGVSFDFAQDRPTPAVNDQIVVRNYRDADYEQVKAIWRENWEDKAMDSRETINYKLVNDRAPFLIAEVDGKVVGTVIASWDGRWAWVSRLAVLIEYRHRGIAKLLMAESERALAALGAGFVSLLVHKDNTVARGLYDALGYTLYEFVGYMSKKLEVREEECCGS